MRLKTCKKEKGLFYDKVYAPEDTINWAKGRFSSMDVPILEEVVRIDKGRLGIPVYISKYTKEAMQITHNLKQMGKGATPEQAEASAIMELSERFSLFYFKDMIKKEIATFKDINERDRLPYDDLFLSLHVEPDKRERKLIEELLQEALFEWALAFYPYEDRMIWLPWSWFWPINEFNGSAAGNSYEEAGVQALCEIVERHVCSLITYKRAVTPAIDPQSFHHPMAKELIERFLSANINLILKDFTMDMGVPTVGAIAWDEATFPHRSEIVYTAGTAPSPERAAIRAITEVAQLAGDFDTDGKYMESGLPKFSTLKDASYVLEQSQIKPISSMVDISNEDFSKEVINIVYSLKKRGYNSYLVDITHPHLRIPAVYAIVPGNHFRDRTINGDMVFHIAKIVATQKIEENNEYSRQRAASVLSYMDDIFPDRYYIAFYRAYIEELSCNFKQAISLYDEAIRRGADKRELASIYCHKGACYREIGDIDMAIKEFERAKGLNPRLKEVRNLLGNCYYLQERFYDAIREFEAAIDIDPSSAIDYANIGSNLRRLGMKETAIQWYEMAISIDPNIDWAKRHLEELKGRLNNT